MISETPPQTIQAKIEITTEKKRQFSNKIYLILGLGFELPKNRVLVGVILRSHGDLLMSMNI